jgi:hypothetical protein
LKNPSKRFEAMRQIICLLVFLLLVSSTLYSQNTSYDANAGNGGYRNSSFGYLAGSSITGTDNLFVGYAAGRYSLSEDYNSFVGYYSGYRNTVGSMNTYFGTRAGQNGVSSDYNVALGYLAGYISTSSRNVSLGHGALSYNESGERNVSIGHSSGHNSSGAYNVFLGYWAGYKESGSNKLYIQNDSSSNPLIYGEFDNDFVVINGNLGVGNADIPDSISLLVDSLIIAKEVVIRPESFPDYVFDEDYNLISLSELETHIKALGHLPGIMSKEEVIEQGIDTGTLSVMLLEKVEELTLYLIKLNGDLNKEEDQQRRLITLLSGLKGNSSVSEHR